MYFYCYNAVPFLTDTIYLYGRILYTEDLNEIEECKSKKCKLTVYPVNSTVLAVYNGNPPSIELLKKDIINYFGTLDLIEEFCMKNLFYDDLDQEIKGIRFLPRNLKSLQNFQSKYCEKILNEFTNPLETFIIQKKIRIPCVLKINTSKTFIKLDNIQESVRTNLPKLNYASLYASYNNQEIMEYEICINGSKIYEGVVKEKNEHNNKLNHKNIINVENKNIINLEYKNIINVDNKNNNNNVDNKNIINVENKNNNNVENKNNNNVDNKNNKLIQENNNRLTHESSSSVYQTIEKIINDEEIDVITFFNLSGNILKIFSKLIICDIYLFASGNIKCREFSIEEICKYYKIDQEKNLNNSKLIYEIFKKSDALLLAKELSEISGYTLNKVLNNNRAEFIEYALFHELYDKKYLLPPEKKQDSQKYVGGLVFEPKKDCYKNLIILLDFNSLYPSIIQEYNVCFSNINFKSTEKGLLPKILSNLVQRRKAVKKLMNESKNPKIYNTRQLALKILANSIYGCLGYPKSRFCNYKLASFITEKGREILQNTKNLIEDQLNYKVIYGDTDSIMINTNLEFTDENIKKAKEISKKVINLINLQYKNIELDLEKIFIKLYLYSKKKYAGKYLDQNNDMKEEYKGIDTVRRDVSLATIDILKKVLTILLNVEDNENNKNDIFLLLANEYDKLKLRDTKDFIISNILSKPVEKYPNNIPLPYVQLCLRLKEKGIIYKNGDTVSFVIGKSNKDEPFYKRAYLPTEDFILDLNYYITQQILPSLNRILSLTNYATIEKLYKIFNVPLTKTYTTKNYKFTLECCKTIQNPSKECKKCNKEITEDFYFKKVTEMVRKEINILYETKLECKNCGISYDGIFLNCRFCNFELDYEIKNYEFDNFLDELLTNFKDLKFEKVSKYLKSILNISEFRLFDISLYFKEEIEKYLLN